MKNTKPTFILTPGDKTRNCNICKRTIARKVERWRGLDMAKVDQKYCDYSGLKIKKRSVCERFEEEE